LVNIAYNYVIWYNNITLKGEATLNIISFIKNNSDWKTKLLDEFGISTKQDLEISQNIASFSYDQIASPKSHPLTKEARGLVLDINSLKPLSRPFDRFYNYGEVPEETKSIDFNNAKFFEKLDGSLITFYFSEEHNLWKISTKSTPFARNAITRNRIPFLSLISETINGKADFITIPENIFFVDSNSYDSLIKKINETLEPTLNKNYSYICELTSPHNIIVTQYDETSIHLLAVRDKNGDYVENHNPIPHVFKEPETYQATSLDELMHFIGSMNKGRETLLEGVVAMDNKTNSAYLKVHKLMNREIDDKAILDIVADQEESEFLLYYPELEDRFSLFVDARETAISKIEEGIKKSETISDRKELANTLKEMNVMPFVFPAMKNNIKNPRLAFSNNNIKSRIQAIKDFM
jgi:hypothetical protein